MGLTRKTILKRLEHINLSNWHILKSVDQSITMCEDDLESNPDPGNEILLAMFLIGFQLWGVPSTKISLEALLNKVLAAGGKYIRSQRRYEEIWLNKMSSVLVIASLGEDITELIRFSNWFKVEKVQPTGLVHDMTHQPILYYVADMFRDVKFDNYDRLKKLQSSSRVKEPRLLLSALDGIRSMDSKRTFDDLIAASLDHAQRTNIDIRNESIFNTWEILALVPSLLWNVAELKGLQPPTMPPEIRPFMLTRQTLGL